MNVDQQLVIGIVFIVAGIAVALLAYAAYLNREQPADEAEEMERPSPLGEVQTGGQPKPSEPGASPAPAETPQPAGDPHDVHPAPPQPTPEATPESSGEATHQHRDESGGPATVQPDSAAQSSPSVQLKRSRESGRLNVDVDGRVYGSIEELRASPDWKRVDHLFSDMLAWLIKEQPAQEEGVIPEEEAVQDRPLSMVEQINQILVEKLDAREGGPKAVRLMEETGGTIRVYIGMDSYPMDEVPDEEVQAIIRQAVREWEARQ